jgi:hypothetical protein
MQINGAAKGRSASELRGEDAGGSNLPDTGLKG